MKKRSQIVVLIIILMTLGISAALYKHLALGFQFIPGGTETIWKVEAKITYVADGGPVKVSLALPMRKDQQKRIEAQNVAVDYSYRLIQNDGVRYAVWTRGKAEGEQTIFAQASFFFESNQIDHIPDDLSIEPTSPLDEKQYQAALAVIQQAQAASADSLSTAMNIIAMFDADEPSDNVQLISGDARYRHEVFEQVSKVLAIAEIPSRMVRGLRLQDGLTQRSITTFIQVFQKDQWSLIDPRDLSLVEPHKVLLWPTEIEGLLDVHGGRQSSIYFSVLETHGNAERLAIEAAKEEDAVLIDFSIYSLPISAQNSFKLLLLIPLGALIVVIMRNLVGIRTSGTFMPILIALTFAQTTLALGLVLFLSVVGIGLLMRSYLSHLNLLLVPRIASVLVFVIGIYAGTAIISHKLGWYDGLAVTFFPMIILAWTIERMSVLWEEEGGHEVMIQGGGSLLTAVIAYLFMFNEVMEHLVFNFPELLLVVLGVIIAIGSYSGYRLLELTRFEPMTRYDLTPNSQAKE